MRRPLSSSGSRDQSVNGSDDAENVCIYITECLIKGACLMSTATHLFDISNKTTKRRQSMMCIILQEKNVIVSSMYDIKYHQSLDIWIISNTTHLFYILNNMYIMHQLLVNLLRKKVYHLQTSLSGRLHIITRIRRVIYCNFHVTCWVGTYFIEQYLGR